MLWRGKGLKETLRLKGWVGVEVQKFIFVSINHDRGIEVSVDDVVRN